MIYSTSAGVLHPWEFNLYLKKMKSSFSCCVFIPIENSQLVTKKNQIASFARFSFASRSVNISKTRTSSDKKIDNDCIFLWYHPCCIKALAVIGFLFTCGEKNVTPCVTSHERAKFKAAPLSHLLKRKKKKRKMISMNTCAQKVISEVGIVFFVFFFFLWKNHSPLKFYSYQQTGLKSALC
jgi:hypothetical protein